MFLMKYTTCQILGILFTAYLLSCLMSCANPVAPSGGPIDEDPPVLDTMASSTLLPVNFAEERITLVFDEFIKVNNPTNAILISPPLSETPEYKVRGKSLIVEFDEEEELRPNTTYTINFGDALRDLTADNVLENFLYAFSTGEFIDSLELRVQLIDSYTNEPLSDAMAMLHPMGKDSAVFQDKPIYFAVTGEDGIAHLQFLRADSFKLFALVDENRNFLLDLPGEVVGSYPDPIILPEDHGELKSVRMYAREERLFLSHRRWEDGVRLLVNYNRPVQSVRFNFPQLDEPVRHTYYGDTTVFHFGVQSPTDTLKLEVTSLPETRDSVFIPPPRNSDVSSLRNKRYQGGLSPGEQAVIQFNQLLDSLDITAIQWVDTLQGDQNKIKNWQIAGDSLILDLDLEQGKRGMWLFTPGALVDIHGQINDTLELSFNRSTVGNYSNLDLTLEELDSAIQYIFIVEDPSGVEIEKTVVSGVEEFLWELHYIRPGNYTLRVVEDVNHNNRWDAGSILTGREAERVVTHKITDLRANWDFEQTIVPFID